MQAISSVNWKIAYICTVCALILIVNGLIIFGLYKIVKIKSEAKKKQRVEDGDMSVQDENCDNEGGTTGRRLNASD